MGVGLVSFGSTGSVKAFICVGEVLRRVSLVGSSSFFFCVCLHENFSVAGLRLPSGSGVVCIPALRLTVFEVLFRRMFFCFCLGGTSFFCTPYLSLPLFIGSCGVLAVRSVMPFVLGGGCKLFHGCFVP